jgi:clan AA aspartic protease (TIGR02281 family)
MIDLLTVPARLNDIDRVLGARFRRDVAAECNQKAKSAVDAFTAWARLSAEALEIERQQLDRDLQELNALHAAIDASSRALSVERPDGADQQARQRYERMVTEHNAEVARHRALSGAYTTKQSAFNRRVVERNDEVERRQRDADAVQASVRKDYDEYAAWRTARGEEAFFDDVNRLYADLHEALPRARADAGIVKTYLNQLRVVRQEMALLARRREQEAEHGVLIVPATLSDDEECHLIVDTGATTVALSPEMVRAAGLADRLGEEVEVVIAGGLRARGRRITLPRLGVQTMVAENVDAIQLNASHCGVDGLLGLSFLNFFNYMVEREKPQRLRLSLKGEALNTYDVFISYNSDDEWWARVVFDALTVLKYRPFLSDISLRDMHDADYGRAIESAVSAARHLVVVGTSKENLASRWVDKEWRFFVHLQLTHSKSGNVVTVPCGDMRMEDLPPGLSYYQSVSIFERDFRDRLRDFLPLT